VKQLITRLDEGLHARLRARADAERTSVNRLVVEAIERLLTGDDEVAVDEHERTQARARLLGVLASRPGIPCDAGRRESTVRATAGVGSFAAEALDADRGPR